MQRTPPPTPPISASHSSSVPNLKDMSDCSRVSDVSQDYINIQRYKRPRTDDTEGNQFIIFQESIMTMLNDWKADQDRKFNDWKADQDRKLDKLTDNITQVMSQNVKIQESYHEIEKSIDYLSKKYDDVESRMSTYEHQKKEDCAVVRSLEKQCNNLQHRIDDIQNELNSKEQWARYKNIELKGIPQGKDENLHDILCNIGKKINYPISNNQLDFVTRVQTREQNQPKPIIACFTNKYVKENFIAAARLFIKTSPLLPTSLGLHGTHRIFINDHLTNTNKNLLSSAKKVAKERGFQFVWVKNCKLYVRKNITSPVIQITTEKDISKIV
ncbi:uncharacterized protein LOC131847545 [Achroia grisella]|uniref:uncharacterized protein LOC131847545 n=1 Tax=Achroia grisella TaxID=688607 RepID=UPI0027D2A9F7|nr:uncharacterized protein LOC131847545 [Achroia grisella]